MLRCWMERLREASKEGAVLVEGKRDREALQRYGVKHLFTLEGKRFSDLPDLLEGFEKVILLFDLDEQGERIKKKVKEILGREGYILIEDFREELRVLGITFVEELYGKVLGAERFACSGQAHKA
ncbi:MAG: toprim domain-containing protein [Aquificaceae bacterium]|nr:toprim domain-containing protein [Aquificaceae bacterium]